jgi:hypothetical protein
MNLSQQPRDRHDRVLFLRHELQAPAQAERQGARSVPAPVRGDSYVEIDCDDTRCWISGGDTFAAGQILHIDRAIKLFVERYSAEAALLYYEYEGDHGEELLVPPHLDETTEQVNLRRRKIAALEAEIDEAARHPGARMSYSCCDFTDDVGGDFVRRGLVRDSDMQEDLAHNAGLVLGSLNALHSAAKLVVERWEHGDLAEAVRQLDAALKPGMEVEAKPKRKTKHVCTTCGSSAVYADAFASLNDESDVTTYDDTWCKHCEESCHTQEVPIDTPEPENEEGES